MLKVRVPVYSSVMTRTILFVAALTLAGCASSQTKPSCPDERAIEAGFGDEVDRDNVAWFGPGDYYVNAMHAHHFVLTDGPAVLQITGIGPWTVTFSEGI